MASEPGPVAEPAALPATAEAVLRFLESAGRRSEAELYLRLFQELPKESFAIIAPGAPVIRQGHGAFTEQLRFLADLGLRAPVVLGLLDPAQARSTVERLRKRLQAAAIEPTHHLATEPDLAQQLRRELRESRVPLVELADDPAVGLGDRIAWVARLAEQLDTRKLVLLRRRGPLHLVNDRSQELAQRSLLPLDDSAVSLVNLRTDAEILIGQKLLRRDDQRLLELARDLLTGCGASRLLVSVTSPLDLLRELFTTKGAGTLIKRGSLVQRTSSYQGLDLPRLERLLESSFAYELRDEFFGKPPLAVYVEQDYRAAAILHETTIAPYLSKFAVDPVAQGEGMGRDLWQALARDFPRMFWRTRSDNPISAWYAGVCDGLHRLPEWHVFWRGVEPTDVPAVLDHALALGDDFVR